MLITELEGVEDKKQSLVSEEKIHPWRLCSTGKHFVKKHIVHMPPSAEHPNGQIIENSTMHILSDHHGELSNYLICFDHSRG